VWRFVDADLINGAYSAALFQSIGRHVGLGTSDETILFWRVIQPTLYIGYHQCISDEVHEAYCLEHNVDIIRRILGGGCGYCDSNQILYSVIGKDGGSIPVNVLDAYKKVLSGMLVALENLGLKAELDPARNGVFVNGRKISGNAQGRFDGSVMINGSFLLDFDFKSMDCILKRPTMNLRPHVTTAREGMVTLSDLMELPDMNHIKQVLRTGFEEGLGVKTYEGSISVAEDTLAKELTLLYTSKDWTFQMDDKKAKRQKIKQSLLNQ
jgi:lipoate-protein ligase A